jgi:hypothetical protein
MLGFLDIDGDLALGEVCFGGQMGQLPGLLKSQQFYLGLGPLGRVWKESV